MGRASLTLQREKIFFPLLPLLITAKWKKWHSRLLAWPSSSSSVWTWQCPRAAAGGGFCQNCEQLFSWPCRVIVLFKTLSPAKDLSQLWHYLRLYLRNANSTHAKLMNRRCHAIKIVAESFSYSHRRAKVRNWNSILLCPNHNFVFFFFQVVIVCLFNYTAPSL